MSHWACHPSSMQCINGHKYSSPKQANMSLFFGDRGALTLALACHRCLPVTYAFGILYTVKPIPMCYFYSCPDQEAFTLVQKMDDEEVPLDRILAYLNESPPRAA